MRSHACEFWGWYPRGNHNAHSRPGGRYDDPVLSVIPSAQDGLRMTEDETISSLDGTDCLSATKDGIDGL